MREKTRNSLLNLGVFWAIFINFLSPGRAEKIDMSPVGLRATATHIITGKVTAVYTRSETKSGWSYTRYLAEIRVRECEKGDSIKKDALTYVRYWTRSWIGKGMPLSTSGHRGKPVEGDSVRVYLARNAYDGFYYNNKDGGFNVIGANGFEKIKAEASLSSKEKLADIEKNKTDKIPANQGFPGKWELIDRDIFIGIKLYQDGKCAAREYKFGNFKKTTFGTWVKNEDQSITISFLAYFVRKNIESKSVLKAIITKNGRLRVNKINSDNFMTLQKKKEAAENELLRLRTEELKAIRTELISQWPKNASVLFQGLHKQLDAKVADMDGHKKALASIPKNLLKGYKTGKTIELNGWFCTSIDLMNTSKSSFERVVATRKGDNKIHFSLTW